MRISRWCSVVAAAALLAVVIAPAAASALLTNEWNQQFAGTDVCVSCHGTTYNETTHGLFAKTGADISPATGSGMWPIGTGQGGSITSDNVFDLGEGTGLHEYIKFGAGTATAPFGVIAAEWNPEEPTLWEIDSSKPAGYESGGYGCGQCHMLGAVKTGITPPAVGNFAAGGTFTRVAGSANTWALPAGADPAVFASWIPGSSIQCERCHGTGVAATSGNGGHWNSGVKIVGFNSPTMKSTAKAASTKILDSQVCGQCHGSYKSGGNIAGYTPDQDVKSFVPNFYTLADVPTEASFTANPSAYKFFPNGSNKGNGHVYYTEWALSGHSIRGAITATDTRATPYQAAGKSHFSSAGSARLLCNRCHTGEGYLKRKGAAIMSGWTEGVDTAGNYGQECATCHIAHGATTVEGGEVGMGVRAPEKANGQYSTLGLNVDNKSLCEDCHNWQREITDAGAAPNLSTYAILGARYASHPQREIYHGRAMLEIPAGTDFMPGAKCEQCHMPATRGAKADALPRYVDRASKRYSHRMFIMRPGDAKKWGLLPAGDSCSPCHAGETQDALEANLVTWQDTAAALANEVSTVIAAQVTAGHNVAAGDVDLLKRASANWSLFNQDSSGGAHNPPYEQAGLKKAIELAKSAGGTISVTAPAKVGSSALFGIQGMVTNGNGTPAVGVTVTLYKGATLLGTIASDANGNYAFAYAQTVAGSYTVKWARSSQAVSDLTASASVGMIVPPVETDISLTINRASARRSITSYTLSGVLSGAPAGSPVVLSYKRPGETTWRSWVTVTTDSAGAFSKTTRGYALGYYTYRAKFVTTSAYLGSSAQARIRIVR